MGKVITKNNTSMKICNLHASVVCIFNTETWITLK